MRKFKQIEGFLATPLLEKYYQFLFFFLKIFPGRVSVNAFAFKKFSLLVASGTSDLWYILSMAPSVYAMNTFSPRHLHLN